MMMTGVLVGVMVASGCTTMQPGFTPPDGQQDPIVGLWISREPDTMTYYRFWENNTFDGWSHTGDSHPRYSYQYRGEWKSRSTHEYSTKGPHIGYGEVTALAIWGDLTFVYDPASDTLTIPVRRDQAFSRMSHDPDHLPELNHSGTEEVPAGVFSR